MDHLGVGDSSQHDPERLSYTPVVAANVAAETDVLQKLAAGTLMEGVAKVEDPLTIGLGQSMGGCLTIVQQGRHHCYDGIGVLGYSALHTHPPTAPGTPPIVMPWVPRDTQLADGVFTNAPALTDAAASGTEAAPGAEAMAWGFYYDDVDPALVARDLGDFPARHGDVPPWGSATVPATVALWCLAPGAVLAEAAGIESPVLVALGERDVLVDPRGATRLRVGPQRRPLHLPQDGPHAQLRRDPGVVLEAYRDVGGVGAGRARRAGVPDGPRDGR